MLTKRVLLFCMAVLLPGCARSVVSPAQPVKPNIILIMADDVGYECFGCYGSRQYSTPHLDRMAANGIRFDHAYSQPLCTPSRVKIMTGLWNSRNYSAFSVLNRDQRTFGHFFQDAGYQTMVAGKWQLLGAENYDEQFRGRGTWPADAGFDRHCLWQVDKLGERYWGPKLTIDGEDQQFPEDTFGPDVVTDYICDFLAANRDQPFFAYYPMILVHSPFVPTPDSADRASKYKQRNFEDMVAYMDRLVGRIIRQTEELGIADRTLILFAGDNGTHRTLQSVLNGRTIQGGKGLTTDAGNHVPLIGLWPGTIPPGQVSGDIIEFSDFVPTLLETAGVQPPRPFDGHSFLPQLKGQPGAPRDHMFTYYCPRPEKTEPVYFVREQRWKLYGDGRFYDVIEDPLEENLVSDPPEGSAAAQAKSKLEAALKTKPTKGQTLLRFVP